MAKFQPGTSGNTAGRPKNKTPATAIRKAIADNSTRIVQTLIELALEGDVQAARCLLDKICPSLKATAPAVELPDASGKGLSEQGAAVISAAMMGDIAPDVAGQLLSALASQAKLVEVSELEKRIESIEHILGSRR